MFLLFFCVFPIHYVESATYQIDMGVSVNDTPIGLSDTIWTYTEAAFDIYYENSDTLGSYSTGFTIWSDDGTDWLWQEYLQDVVYIPGTNPPEFDTVYSIVTAVEGSRQYPPSLIWDKNSLQLNLADTNGSPRDSILFGGERQDHGLYPGPLERQILMHFSARGLAEGEIKTICIDSVKVGPAGDFIFVDRAGQPHTPVILWPEGGRCWIVKGSANEPPGFTNCPSSAVEVDHCEMGQYDLDATDNENDPFEFEITGNTGNGIADIDPLSGLVTYQPHDDDVNSTITITVRVYDAYGENTCDIDFMINNNSPAIDCGQLSVAVGMCKLIVKSDIIADNADTCDDLEYSVFSGPGEINPVTGVYSWQTAVGDTLGSPHLITVQVTDGFDTDNCSFEVQVIRPFPLLAITEIEEAEDRIYDALKYGGVDTILFEVSGIISITEPFPAIWWPITILGSTAPGGAGSFVIDGSTLSVGSGLEIESSNNKIEGLTIKDFPENGIKVTGTSSVNNTITRNLIYSNNLLGIDLGGDGVTPNDPDDSDTGPNNLLNFPEFDSAVYQPDGSFMLFGSAPPEARVELFVAHPAGGDPEHTSGHGEACEYIGFINADLSGDFSYQIDGAVYGPFTKITATATDNAGNTSEFSENIELGTGPLTVIAYSPVNLIIKDPEDKRFGWDADGNVINEIAPDSGNYFETPNDSLVIYDPKPGNYTVFIVTQTGPLPKDDDKYSSIIRLNGSFNMVIAANQTVPQAGVPHSFEYDIEDGFHYVNGNANGDKVVNIGDAVFINNLVFHSGPAPDPILAGDANCDLSTNLGDAVYLINFIFNSGPEPCHFEVE
jgi:hypothetical protein